MTYSSRRSNDKMVTWNAELDRDMFFNIIKVNGFSPKKGLWQEIAANMGDEFTSEAVR